MQQHLSVFYFVVLSYKDSHSDEDEDSQSGDDDPHDSDYKPPSSFTRIMKNIVQNLTDPNKNNAAKEHISNNQPRKPRKKVRKFECNHCHKKMRTKLLLSKHMKLHAGISKRISGFGSSPQDGVFPCSECKKHFSSAYVLNYHMTHIHNKKPAKPMSAQLAKMGPVGGKLKMIVDTFSSDLDLCQPCGDNMKRSQFLIFSILRQIPGHDHSFA